MSDVGAAPAGGSGTGNPRSARPSSLALLLNNRLAALGLLVLAVIAVAALAAPILPLPDPNATAPADRLQPLLAAGHPFGTDALGRDTLSRLVWGARVSLAVGVSASLIAAMLGSAIGLVAGYAGGRTDGLLMRLIDMLMAFPYILLALAIVAVLGPGLINALYAIAIVNVPFFARNIRGVTLGLARREFVDAARLSGKGPVRILVTEIGPNVLPTIVITLSTTVGWMILETAGLSFLGLGAQPPQADLGSMLGEGRKLLFTAPTVALVPGLAIFLIVMSINLLGDGIRDVLDPRLRSGALTRPAFRTAIAKDRRKPAATGSEVGAALAVHDLRTEFHTGRETLRAVDGVDLTVGPGECLGLVGESGSGKSVTAMSVAGLVPTPPGVIAGGGVRFEGEDLLAAPDERIRTLRGGRISHVFQDPLATLHPLFTVGDQIVEVIRAHQPVSRARPRRRRWSCWRGAHPQPDGAHRRPIRTNSPGACASASDRHGAGLRPRAHHRRRADDGARRDGAGAGARLLDELRRERGVAMLFITHDLASVARSATASR